MSTQWVIPGTAEVLHIWLLFRWIYSMMSSRVVCLAHGHLSVPGHTLAAGTSSRRHFELTLIQWVLLPWSQCWESWLQISLCRSSTSFHPIIPVSLKHLTIKSESSYHFKTGTLFTVWPLGAGQTAVHTQNIKTLQLPETQIMNRPNRVLSLTPSGVESYRFGLIWQKNLVLQPELSKILHGIWDRVIQWMDFANSICWWVFPRMQQPTIWGYKYPWMEITPLVALIGFEMSVSDSFAN